MRSEALLSVAMDGMVDLLKYRDPLPDRFNLYLKKPPMLLRKSANWEFHGQWRLEVFLIR